MSVTLGGTIREYLRLMSEQDDRRAIPDLPKGFVKVGWSAQGKLIGEARKPEVIVSAPHFHGGVFQERDPGLFEGFPDLRQIARHAQS